MAWVIRRASAGGRVRYQGMYRDPSGRQRSAGNYSTERQALRAAGKAEAAIEAGIWFDVSAGKVTFRVYAREVWWPSLHLEPTTKAAYKSNLEKHFLPFFGDLRMANILPSHVQVWVNQALDGGLTPRSVVKYHVVLHSSWARRPCTHRSCTCSASPAGRCSTTTPPASNGPGPVPGRTRSNDRRLAAACGVRRSTPRGESTDGTR